MTFTLTAKKRDVSASSPEKLLQEGQLPAVVYGPKQPSTPIVIPLRDFDKILRNAGESSVIELQGLDGALQVLIHEVDRDPLTNNPRHADLYAIEKGAKVEVAVPISYVGESAAVKAGANLVKVMHELEIEAAPADLPSEIEVDISVLATIGDQIHVSDLSLPQGVVAHDDAEQVVALVQAVEIEEESPIGAPDMAAIEVEKKGKTEEEGAEA